MALICSVSVANRSERHLNYTARLARGASFPQRFDRLKAPGPNFAL
jgi:hypothetical protein